MNQPPKEKAEELVYKFMDTRIPWKQSKLCALIAVDEILFVLEFNLDFRMDRSIGYYLEVKKEIQNL
jgi:hypothetical protein